MLKEMEVSQQSKNKKYTTQSSLRTPNSLLLEYRLLETIIFYTNDMVGRMALPFNALIGQFAIFSIVTLIRDWGTLDSSSIYVLSGTSSVLMIFWIFVLELCGRESSIGRRILKSWKLLKFQSSSEAKYFHKIRKAYPLIQIGVPGLFTFKRKTVLSFVKGISRGTFRALMALK
jgi:hypothetical protein